MCISKTPQVRKIGSRSLGLRRRRLAIAVALVSPLVFLLTGQTAFAQSVLYVDDDGAAGNGCTGWADACPNLQTALGLAESGDQIWVAAGTYVGNFTLALGVEVYGGFDGTETELSQRDWAANPTILDGNRSGSVVTSPAGATETTRIDGFTITNGSGTPSMPPYTEGGGLLLDSSSPTIVNNMITGNSASHGGGLHLDHSSPTIANNTITGNSADSYGGALYLSSSSPTIANNTITVNSTEGIGGGLCLVDAAPTIANNAITGNSASWGGGLYLRYSSATIVNSAIAANSARDNGGGMYLLYSSPTIANNTITDNSADEGAGLYLWDSSPTVANNTIMGNSASDDGGGMCVYDSSPTIANTIVAFNSSGIFGSSSAPTLRHNCVYGNTEYEYSGLTDPTGMDGNISADPLLADLAYGNTHIQPDSPCVDAGNNSDAYGESDIDGERRIQPLGGTVDIGADESGGTVWPAGPYVIVRVSPTGDDANDGSSWALPKRTVQASVDLASALGGEVWVQAGTYEERITLLPYAYVYGGFAGDETIRDERDWGVNVTTLDGQQQGLVVTARVGYGAVGAVDGFTITNGSGCGLYLRFSSPTIANNTITGNDGCGLGLKSSSPTIANNTITGNDGSGLALSESAATVRNNKISSNSGYYGGGLYVRDSSPTIANNTIMGNSAESYAGGGLYVRDSSPTIANNTIAGNSAYAGGGLYVWDSSPTIASNTITCNSAGYGGGLYLGSSDPTITNNTITDNSAEHGGGLYMWASSPAITNNTIADNSADDNGGGLHVEYSSPNIAINTISGNSADWGGGMYTEEGSPTVANSTFAGNSAANGRALACDSWRLGYPSTVRIANCILWDGADEIWNNDDSTITVTYSDVQDDEPDDGTVHPGTGNIDDDPLFVNALGPDGIPGTEDDDLRLSPGSPCIDAGDNTAVPADVVTDLDGNPRFVDDPLTPDTGVGPPPIVDMGAFEFQPVEVLRVGLDIHPGRCPNWLNVMSNARVRMAVVGTDAFDVTQIDTDSLVLERADGLAGSLMSWDRRRGNAISVTDAATPFDGDLCDCHRVRRDGIDDLVLSFSTRDIVEELDLRGIGPRTPMILTLRGLLLDGTPFDASDCILTFGGRPIVTGRSLYRDGKD